MAGVVTARRLVSASRHHIADEGALLGQPAIIVPAIQSFECHLWWAKRSDAHPMLETFLNDDERRRLLAFQRRSDQERFLTACGVMRLALSGYLLLPPADVAISRQCDRCGEGHGKPRVASGAAMDISVAHSGDLVVVAFTDGARVGVDVERIRSDASLIELKAAALTPSEAVILAPGHPREASSRFFVYWARKEAVLKATGRGLSVSLQRLTVSAPEQPPRLLTYVDDPDLPRSLSLFDLPTEAGYTAALAVIGRISHAIPLDGSALIARWLSAGPDLSR